MSKTKDAVGESQIGRKYVGKKLKVTAITLNIVFLITAIIFNYFMYRWISANDFLAIKYIGYKKPIIAEALLVLVIIVAFALKKGKKRTIASCIVSGVMIVVMITGSILEVIYHDKINNIFAKADSTLDTIVENSKLSTDEYGVYVLKADSAKEIKDTASYTFSYSTTYQVKDMTEIQSSIEKELTNGISLKAFSDPVEMASFMFKGKPNRAIILNQTVIEYIEGAGDEDDNEQKDGEYANFLDDLKCIYKISVENALNTKNANKDVTKECFIGYISGIDIEGDVTTKSRSDVNIIACVNPITHQILLISTPRDYYVPLSISNGMRDKLTHAGNYGVDVSMDTLQMLYETEIDYFVRLNFTGFVNIIDALGGIDIESDYTFYTHGCQFYEGLNENVAGSRAIWFARERHSFADGDRQRGKNQMKVIEAVINKCMSTALLRRYDDIMESISESFQTNMPKKDIRKLVNYQIDESPKWKVLTYSVTGTGTSDVTYSTPNSRAYVMLPDETTVNEAKKLINDMKNNKKIKVKEEK